MTNWRSPYSQKTMVSFEYIDFWPKTCFLGPTIFKLPQPDWYYCTAWSIKYNCWVSRWQWQIIGTKLNTKQTSSKQYQIFTSFEIFFKESSMNVLESVLPPNLPNLGSLLSVLFIKLNGLNFFKKSLLNNEYYLRKSIKLFYLLTVSIKQPVHNTFFQILEA